MNIDDGDVLIDRVLREAGRGWREGAEDMPLLAEIRSVATYQSQATRSRLRQRLAMAAAVVAVAAVAIGVLVLRGGEHQSSPTTGANRRGCDDASLVVDAVQVSHGPTGALMAVSFTYRGDEPCTVSGRGPSVRLVDDRQSVLLAGGQTITSAPRQVEMRPGERLHFTALWSSWCGPTFVTATFDFNPDDGAPGWWLPTHLALGTADVPSCQNGQSAIETDPLQAK